MLEVYWSITFALFLCGMLCAAIWSFMYDGEPWGRRAIQCALVVGLFCWAWPLVLPAVGCYALFRAVRIAVRG